MTRTPAWRRYVRFWRPNIAADVDDELQFHIDMLARTYEAQGMSKEEILAYFYGSITYTRAERG